MPQEVTIHDLRHPYLQAVLGKRLLRAQTGPSATGEGQPLNRKARRKRRRTRNTPQDAVLAALRGGQTGRIGIPELVVRDLRDRGEDLAAVFAPCPLEGGLLDEFRGARGYSFCWGHIIEHPSQVDGAGDNHEWTNWYFYIEEVWRAAMVLDARNSSTVERSFLDRAVDMYISLVAAKLPSYLDIDEGLSFDLFGISTMPDGAGVRDDWRARAWLAERFVPYVLPQITTRVLDWLSTVRINEKGNVP